MSPLQRFLALYLTILTIHLSTCKLTILEPFGLASKFANKSIEYTLARFGSEPWGNNLIGQIYYPEPHDACMPIDGTGIYFSYNKEIDPANNPIILVDRGMCTLTTKAKYAQLVGAKLLIIIDNKEENTANITLADNGQGIYLHIPTIMISKADGETLKDYISSISNQSNTTEPPTSISPIVMKITFPAQKEIAQVQYEFWYSSLHPASLDFLDKFKTYHNLIADRVDFTPKFVIWYCQFCQTLNWTVENEPDCFSGGRYCAPDPDKSGPATGRQVVTEDLRQKCIWKNRADNEYWEYISLMYHQCVKTPASDECRQKVYDSLNWDNATVQLIELCTTEGFAGSNHLLEDNSVLKEERDDYIREGVQYSPSIFIEHKQYQGEMEPLDVFKAICDKFTNPPEGCTIHESQIAQTPAESETDWSAIFLIVGTMIILLLFALFIYKRNLKREMLKDMNNQVSTMISQYYALNEGKNMKAHNIHDSL